MNIKCAGQIADPGILKHYSKNANKHSPEQIDRIAKLLEFYGQRRPLIISNLSHEVTAGNATLMAIKKLGWKECAVDFQDFVTMDEEYAFHIADNEIKMWSEIDRALVSAELENLGPMDIDLLGFENFVVDLSEIKLPEEPKQEGPKCPMCGK